MWLHVKHKYHVTVTSQILFIFHTHLSNIFVCIIEMRAYLCDLGVCAAAVSSGSVHPGGLRGRALLSEGALLISYAPATLEPRVCLQTLAAAASQCKALIQVSCRWEGREKCCDWILFRYYKSKRRHRCQQFLKIFMSQANKEKQTTFTIPMSPWKCIW